LEGPEEQNQGCLCNQHTELCRGSVRNMQSRNKVIWSRAELLQSGRELATKVENNLGLSSCAVPQSAVICVVAYFRRTELLPGVQERSSI